MTVEAKHRRRSAKSNTSNKIDAPIAQRNIAKLLPPAKGNETECEQLNLLLSIEHS